MVIVFSDPNDISSKKVIEWLLKFKQKVAIVNRKDKDFIDLENLDKNSFKINLNGIIVDSNQIKSIYYRRSGKISRLQSVLKNNSILKLNAKDRKFITYLAGNELAKGEILKKNLDEKRVFGGEYIGRTNKFLALEAAKKVGFDIPETIMTGSKKILSDFNKKHTKIICKSIDLSYFYSNNSYNYMGYTNVLDKDYFKKMKPKFALTLFQQYIEKDFEIRCFCFNQYFYSVAYFSQNNHKTKVDYRRYDNENPNRQIPINIPRDLKRKIILLLKELGLNTGSLDIIARGNKYYFLEINPVGIFDNVSVYGNWYIEREIAKYLMNGKQTKE